MLGHILFLNLPPDYTLFLIVPQMVPFNTPNSSPSLVLIKRVMTTIQVPYIAGISIAGIDTFAFFCYPGS